MRRLTVVSTLPLRDLVFLAALAHLGNTQDAGRLPTKHRLRTICPAPFLYAEGLLRLQRSGIIEIDEPMVAGICDHWYADGPDGLPGFRALTFPLRSLARLSLDALRKKVLNGAEEQGATRLLLARAEAEGHLGRLLALHRFDHRWAALLGPEFTQASQTKPLVALWRNNELALNQMASAFLRGPVTAGVLFDKLRRALQSESKPSLQDIRRISSAEAGELSLMTRVFVRESGLGHSFWTVVGNPRRSEALCKASDRGRAMRQCSR